MLLFIWNDSGICQCPKSFNTSHVTLYRHEGFKKLAGRPFQYIPCYSLSARKYALNGLFCMFQYIPCYSLSKKKPDCKVNTTCFNTSHVTLYPIYKRSRSQIYKVSIHPMLLFIVISQTHSRRHSSFNTSHVTLYLQHRMQLLTTSYVSIHPMLLFIKELSRTKKLVTCFNTSHVTLYLCQNPLSQSVIRCFNTSHVTLYPSFYRLFFF